MQALQFWIVVCASALFVPACSGTNTVIHSDEGNKASSRGGASSSEGSINTSGAGESSNGDAGANAPGEADRTPAGFPRCGALDPERADDCSGIDTIALLDPRISSNVDGSIDVGELAPVDVYAENQGDTIVGRVCVGVVVDQKGINLWTDPGRTNPTVIGTLPAGGGGYVSPAGFSVEHAMPGTIARFTFWSTFEGTNCSGPTTTAEVPVKAYP